MLPSTDAGRTQTHRSHRITFSLFAGEEVGFMTCGTR